MVGFKADKDSLLSQATQYKPPSLWLKHKGIEAVKKDASHLLDQLRNGTADKTLSGIKGVQTTLEKIIGADLNTVLISEDAFRKYAHPLSEKTGNAVQFTGTEINYVRHLESVLDKEAFEEIMSGQRYLPGGIGSRFPQIVPGVHTQLTQKALMVPKNLKGILGVDNNSFYALTQHSRRIGSDSDGDHEMLFFAQINNMKHMNELIKEDREALKKIVSEPSILNAINKKKYSYDNNGNIIKVHISESNWISHWQDDGKASVTSLELDKQGNLITNHKSFNASQLDITEFPEALVNLATGAAKHVPGYADANDYFQAHMTKAMMPGLAKQLIPQATNILKKRASQLIAGTTIGKLPGGPGAFAALLGTTDYGFSGLMGQLPISLTKHSGEANISKVVRAIEFMGNVDKHYDRKDEFINLMWDFGGYEKRTPETQIPFEGFKRDVTSAIDLFRNFDIIDRTNPDVKSLDYSSLNTLSGRAKSTWFDFMKVKDVDPTFFFDEKGKGLSDMVGGPRFNIDISDSVARSFKKGGKYAAIGAAVLLGASMFKPISPSNSNSPFGAYIGLGGQDNNLNLLQSQLELPRGVPLDVVGASFSNEAFIKLNGNKNYNKDKAALLSNLLKKSAIIQPYDFYNVPVQSNHNYVNYASTIPFMGTTNLQRRYTM
jgi:hypothetical protein